MSDLTISILVHVFAFSVDSLAEAAKLRIVTTRWLDCIENYSATMWKGIAAAIAAAPNSPPPPPALATTTRARSSKFAFDPSLYSRTLRNQFLDCCCYPQALPMLVYVLDRGGLDPNPLRRVTSGSPPLVLAAAAGNVRGARALVELGKHDINLPRTDKKTPLEVAVSRGQADFALWMLHEFGHSSDNKKNQPQLKLPPASEFLFELLRPKPRPAPMAQSESAEAEAIARLIHEKDCYTKFVTALANYSSELPAFLIDKLLAQHRQENVLHVLADVSPPWRDTGSQGNGDIFAATSRACDATLGLLKSRLTPNHFCAQYLDCGDRVGDTPIVRALRRGTKFLQTLLACRADPNAVPRTLIFAVSITQNPAAVALLLQHGARLVPPQSESSSSVPPTPPLSEVFIAAIETCHAPLPMLDVLLSACREHSNSSAVLAAAMAPADAASLCPGMTALHAAIFRLHHDAQGISGLSSPHCTGNATVWASVARLLLEHGADPCSSEYKADVELPGNTTTIGVPYSPLDALVDFFHLASSYSFPGADMCDLRSLFLKAWAKTAEALLFDTFLAEPHRSKLVVSSIALLAAAASSSSRLLRELLSIFPDPVDSVRDATGASLLWVAAAAGREDNVKLLLSAPFSMSAFDSSCPRFSALAAACQARNLSILKLLVEKQRQETTQQPLAPLREREPNLMHHAAAGTDWSVGALPVRFSRLQQSFMLSPLLSTCVWAGQRDFEPAHSPRQARLVPATEEDKEAIAVLRYLVEQHGFTVDCLDKKRGADPRLSITPLTAAALTSNVIGGSRNAAVMRFLVEDLGADVNHKNSEGVTPLLSLFAVNVSAPPAASIIELLLSRGARCDNATVLTGTASLPAALVDELAQDQSSLRARDSFWMQDISKRFCLIGCTALHLAVRGAFDIDTVLAVFRAAVASSSTDVDPAELLLVRRKNSFSVLCTLLHGLSTDRNVHLLLCIFFQQDDTGKPPLFNEEQRLRLLRWIGGPHGNRTLSDIARDKRRNAILQLVRWPGNEGRGAQGSGGGGDDHGGGGGDGASRGGGGGRGGGRGRGRGGGHHQRGRGQQSGDGGRGGAPAASSQRQQQQQASTNASRGSRGRGRGRGRGGRGRGGGGSQQSAAAAATAV